MNSYNTSVLNVKNLSVSFSRYDRKWNKQDLTMIHSLDVDIHKGEIVAVVGSSGSGKSLLAHSILGILPGNSRIMGSMKLCGQVLNKELQKKARGKDMVLIPQSLDFLDPLMKVGKQIKGTRNDEAKLNAILERYNLDPGVAELYPYQLSGGMARRVLIATAVTEKPKLIIADEPTPGLDLTMARETLMHFRELADGGCGVLLITHDIDLALAIADRIAVFYAGTTVENAPVEDFISGKEALRHPYSRAIFDALPQNDFISIPGFQPYAGNPTDDCLFIDRCPIRTHECKKEIHMRTIRNGKVRCIHAT